MFLKYKNDNQVSSLHNDVWRSYLQQNNQIIAVRSNDLVPNKFPTPQECFKECQAVFKQIPVGTKQIPVVTKHSSRWQPLEFEYHEQGHANPGRDLSSGFVLEFCCFGTTKTIDSALGVFMKVVDNCLSFPENFESSHLDICILRYLQNTKRCSI